MTPRPRFSAILTNYNHSHYLPTALGGILAQTVPFDEILIIDDASTDDSVEVIQGLIAAVPQARLIRNPVNIGVVKSINNGLAQATGDFLFYVAADDSYSPRILERSLALLEQNPALAMISGNARTHHVDSGEERLFTLPFPQHAAIYNGKDLEAMAHKRCVTFYGGANLIRRDAMQAAGGQRPELKWHADWFLYLLLAFRHPFGVIAEECVRIRLASDQYSYAIYDWKKQGPVIETFLRLLKSDFPDAYPIFRRCGLLPTYDLEALWMILRDRELRAYLTPLLIWRLLTYKPLRAIARALVPEQARAGLRRLLRL